MDLKSLAEKYGANKPMDYLKKYEINFAPYRDAKRVFEIGVNTGGSLLMWRDYFPAAQIIGLDIQTDFESCERIQVFKGDQTDYEVLKDIIIQNQGVFDLIIDDGSHRPHHFAKTFDFMFPCLRPGGLYVIEDMGAIHHPSGWPWKEIDASNLTVLMGEMVAEFYGPNAKNISRMDLGKHVSFWWKAGNE